jgi:chemotaxis protein MotB
MNLRQVFVGLTGLGLIVSVGCVAQEEYDAQVMANRKLREQLEQARLELQDARAQSQLASDRVGTLEGELDTKNRLIANLEGERDQHLDAFRRAQAALEELAKRKPQEPIVLTQALPAELDTALRQFAGKHPGSVEFDSRRGIVKWKSDLLFALGSDVVRDSAKPAMAEFATIMSSSAAEPFDVTIVGHTDNTRIAKAATKARHPTNWHLSVHRAISVMEVLRADGLPEARIGVMGYGELRPIAPNTDKDSKARNRRVEIYVVPRTAISLIDGSMGIHRDTQSNVDFFRPTGTPPEK